MTDPKPISLDELDLLRVDGRNRLYWRGERLVTDVRLNWWQSALAIVTAVSTLVMAAESMLRILGKLH